MATLAAAPTALSASARRSWSAARSLRRQGVALAGEPLGQPARALRGLTAHPARDQRDGQQHERRDHPALDPVRRLREQPQAAGDRHHDAGADERHAPARRPEQRGDLAGRRAAPRREQRDRRDGEPGEVGDRAEQMHQQRHSDTALVPYFSATRSGRPPMAHRSGRASAWSWRRLRVTGDVLVAARGVERTFETGKVEVRALRGVDLELRRARWWRSWARAAAARRRCSTASRGSSRSTPARS